MTAAQSAGDPQRPDYASLAPEFIAALRAQTRSLEGFALDQRLRALVELRVSQINGCAYCIDLHAREAAARGEDHQRLIALTAWHESSFFSARERCALGWAESLTRMPETHADEAAFAPLRAHFSETEIVQLSIAIALANFWNRMAGGFRRQPPRVAVQPS